MGLTNMIKKLLLLVLLLAPIGLLAQGGAPCTPGGGSPQVCYYVGSTSTSGTAIQLATNGGTLVSFTYSWTGSPSAVSTTVQGCVRSVCTTIDTYSGSTATTRDNTSFTGGKLNTSYDYFIVTSTWTGSSTFTVTEKNNNSVTPASLSGGAGPSLSGNNTFTGLNTFKQTFQVGTAPTNTMAGGVGNGWQYGLDSAATPPCASFFIARNIGSYTPSLGATDTFFINDNSGYSTLSGNVAIGATTLPLTSNLTLGTAVAGTTYVLIGNCTSGLQPELVTVTAGGGTNSLTVNALNQAHSSGDYVVNVNDLAHQPTVTAGGAGNSPNMRFAVNGDLVHQPSMGGIDILGAIGQRAALSGPLRIHGGNSPSTTLQWWINESYQTAIQSGAVNRTGTDGVTATDTSFCSASAAFTSDDVGKIIVATGVPSSPADYITSITSGTCVALKVATTGTSSGVSWTLYEPVFRLMSNAQFPYLHIGPGQGSGTIISNAGLNCFGPNCPQVPTHTFEVKQSSTSNVTFLVGTASQGSVQTLCNGSSAKCTIATQQSSTLALGTAGCTDTTCAESIDTSNNVAIFKHVNQTAANNFAGTCTMSSGTSCTATISAAFTGTPVCITTVQSATVIAGGCTVSSTTVTITAASSNSSTWGYVLIGNPN